MRNRIWSIQNHFDFVTGQGVSQFPRFDESASMSTIKEKCTIYLAKKRRMSLTWI